MNSNTQVSPPPRPPQSAETELQLHWLPRAKGVLSLSREPDTPSHTAHSYVMRMKEFERERRLLQRKKRREQREADLARG